MHIYTSDWPSVYLSQWIKCNYPMFLLSFNFFKIWLCFFFFLSISNLTLPDLTWWMMSKSWSSADCNRVCLPIWAATRFSRSALISDPRPPSLPVVCERRAAVSLIRPAEEVRKGALLAAAGLPSYFLTRRHAPLHGRVLRSRRGLSESVAGGQVADQEQGSSLEASPLKVAGGGSTSSWSMKCLCIFTFFWFLCLWVFGETALKRGTFKTFWIFSAPPGQWW